MKIMPRVSEIPFDSSRKLMTTVHALKNGRYRIITKGAPDVLLNKCTYYEEQGSIKDLDKSFFELLKNKNEQMAEKALRVLAVAYLDVDILPKQIESETIEKGLIFVGLIGMIDPPRKGVKKQ